jgi:hypothetical protein
LAAAAWVDLAFGDPLPGWPLPGWPPRDEVTGKGRVAAEPTEADEDPFVPVAPGAGDAGERL